MTKALRSGDTELPLGMTRSRERRTRGYFFITTATANRVDRVAGVTIGTERRC